MDSVAASTQRPPPARSVASASPRSRPRSAILDEADAVTLADGARCLRNGVDPGARVERTCDVDPVVLGEGLEDPGVLRKVLLREARHDATRVRQGDADPH